MMRSAFTLIVLLAVVPAPAVAADDTSELRQLIESLQQRLEQQDAELRRLRAEQAELRERVELKSKPQPGSEAGELPQEPAVTKTEQSTLAAQPQPEERQPWWKNERLTIGGYGSFRFEANDLPGD
ncbi:MAG TPA: hypothetical protein VGQ71_05035, partial [Terriglobales bacterium]|nr:hypothetical protein [Terriglobales bacterium]